MCCCKQDKENRHKNLKERYDQALFDRVVKELKLSDEQIAKLREECDKLEVKLCGGNE